MSTEETASALPFSERKETHLRLVDGQMGAIGPPETLFIQKCQVFLRRQVFGLQESMDGVSVCLRAALLVRTVAEPG